MQNKLSAKRKVSVFVLFISIFIIIFFGVNYLFSQIGGNTTPDGEEVSFNNLDKISQDKINFLFLGTDGSDLRTDTILFVSFDKASQKINMISIPRDTRILIGDNYYKINSCVPYGKDDLLFKTIRDITGAPINYYAKVNFDGFKNIIDILGGVDFNVPTNMKYSDPEQDLYINLKAGQQHLDGDKAVQLVRYRGYAEADLQRIKVQQDFIKALIKQKITSDNILKAPAIYTEVLKYVKTNFGLGDLLGNMGMIKIFQEQKEGSINSFELPGTAMMINGASYFIHDPKQTLELFKNNFGGSGSSDMLSTYTELNSKAKPDTFEVSTNEQASDFEDEVSSNELSQPDTTDKGYSKNSTTSSTSKSTNTTTSTTNSTKDTSKSTEQQSSTETKQSSVPDWLKD